jgi:Zn-dependent metalloprotease
MVKQRVHNQDVKMSDWLIGANALIGDKYAIRSMKEPGSAYRNHPALGSDPQPATMTDYKDLPNSPEGDWGGVHINSGIPNFAFYVAAFNRGGYAWNTIGRVWYAAMTDTGRMPHDATFATAKEATLYHARQLFGEGSLELSAVAQGWNEAGVE